MHPRPHVIEDSPPRCTRAQSYEDRMAASQVHEDRAHLLQWPPPHPGEAGGRGLPSSAPHAAHGTSRGAGPRPTGAHASTHEPMRLARLRHPRTTHHIMHARSRSMPGALHAASSNARRPALRTAEQTFPPVRAPTDPPGRRRQARAGSAARGALRVRLRGPWSTVRMVLLRTSTMIGY